MTSIEIKKKLHLLAANERLITHETLVLLKEAEKRKLYRDDGYDSIHTWLIREFKYSGGAANRRIQAARLLRDVPEVAEKFQRGEVTLSALEQTQSRIRKEERRTGQRIPCERKQELVAKVENLTFDQTQRVLASEFPDVKIRHETLRVLNADETSLTVTLTQEQIELLKSCRSYLSHTLPDASWAEVIERLAQEFMRKKTQGNTAAVSLGSKKRFVRKRAGNRCEYKDPRTGVRCESTYQLEVDHITPRALGGSDELSNLRCLCRSHNQLAAEKVFGREKMERFGRRKDRSPKTQNALEDIRV